jgi:hypothetical protein
VPSWPGKKYAMYGPHPRSGTYVCVSGKKRKVILRIANKGSITGMRDYYSLCPKSKECDNKTRVVTDENENTNLTSANLGD